jgi:hypothetical protein
MELPRTAPKFFKLSIIRLLALKIHLLFFERSVDDRTVGERGLIAKET